MTPLHKVTNQVLSQMQSFNDYSEHNGPAQPIRVLDKLEEEFGSEDDVTKLESIFKKLVAGGKMNKKQLIQKLMKAAGAETEVVSSAQDDPFLNENLIEESD